MNAKRLREANERADAACIGAAWSHASETGHVVTFASGEGWSCATCDPDIYPDMRERVGWEYAR